MKMSEYKKMSGSIVKEVFINGLQEWEGYSPV